MKRLLILVTSCAVSLAIAGCSQAAPASTPAPAPTKAAAAPTAAPAAAPTKAPTVAPAAVPIATPAKAAEAPPKIAFPEKGKSITVIMPMAAGGSADMGARVIAAAMEKDLGVSMQVMNKPGAGSQVGVTELAKAKPDGYTIGWTLLPTSMSPYLDPSRQCAYGRKDLAQIANVAFDAQVFAVQGDSKYKTMKDLIDDARARQEQIKTLYTGILGADHLFLLKFQEIAGVKLNMVNFAEGGGSTSSALIGGHVDVNIIPVGNYPAHVKSGAVRFLAIADEKRRDFPGFPTIKEVPTLKELGYDLVWGSSRGISAPAGTPREIINLLSNSVKKVMDDPEVKKRFDDVMLGNRYLGADEYTRYWDDFEKQIKPLVDRELASSKK